MVMELTPPGSSAVKVPVTNTGGVGVGWWGPSLSTSSGLVLIVVSVVGDIVTFLDPISKKDVGVETILLGGLSLWDISLPTSNLTPKLLPVCVGTGLRARELKVVVGSLCVVVNVVEGVVVVVVGGGIVVGAVVVLSLKLTSGILIGDLREGYLVEYFLKGLAVVIILSLVKLFSNTLAAPSHIEKVLEGGGGFSLSNIVWKL